MERLTWYVAAQWPEGIIADGQEIRVPVYVIEANAAEPGAERPRIISEAVDMSTGEVLARGVFRRLTPSPTWVRYPHIEVTVNFRSMTPMEVVKIVQDSLVAAGIPTLEQQWFREDAMAQSTKTLEAATRRWVTVR